MSELPELPRAPRQVRPLPPGGLEAAMAGGRRRRQQAMGAAGGGVTALVLVLIAVLGLPDGGRRDSLEQFAESPTPVPTATAPASEGPTPAPTPTGRLPEPTPEASSAPSPRPAAGPTSSPGRVLPGAPAAEQDPAGLLPGSDRSSSPAPGSTGRPQPTPAPGGGAADSRPAYVEDTDEDAEGGCAAGATTGCTYNSGGREVVRRGAQAQVFFGVCVGASDIGDRVYSFSGGQEKDLSVVSEENAGQEVYRFSSTVRYVQGAHERRARRGRCLQWTGRWDLVTTDGRPVPAGTYVVSLRVRADRQVYENEPDPQPRGLDETITTRITVVD